jgi:ankyrin repeat protein
VASKQPKKKPRRGVDAYGRAPLHDAVIDGNLEAVIGLLKGGADVNAQDNNGCAPLHFAAQANAAEVVKRLLAAGARPDVRDANGNTPLFNAVFNCRGTGDVIALLRSAGADPNARNSHGVSPYSLAQTIANYDVVQFFADLGSNVA